MERMVSERIIRYHNEDSRLSYEIAARVKHLEATLPPNEEEFRMEYALTPIVFSLKDRRIGFKALFYIDDLSETQGPVRSQIHFIKPRTRQILDSLGIKYDIVPSEPEN